MTALRHEARKLVEQMPEEQVPYVIQYIRALKEKVLENEKSLDDEVKATPKMRAFLELEKMLVPISQEIDYDKELAEARDEQFGQIDVLQKVLHLCVP